ncbi:MAG: permease-like cell division protein FtsX [Oscillospiraceae bacterium]|jgi:cell division transport system permease protein|nr:permease-like cell division protein FtsX [Oscillospiraceae bacterium]
MMMSSDGNDGKKTTQNKVKNNASKVSLGYLTKEGFKNIWINRLMSIASIAVLTSCLVMIGCGAMLFSNINSFLDKVESQNVIMVFIQDDLSQSEIDGMGQHIRSIPNIESAEFRSKEALYTQFSQSLGDDAVILQGMKNPIPAAYRVTLRDISRFNETYSSLNKLDGIESIQGSEELADQLASLRTTVTYLSVGIIALLLVVSLFIIANTVRVTMYNRKLEISIMKAVGATNWFIRWPFVIEGILLGFIAGIIAFLMVFAIYSAAMASLFESIAMFGGSAVSFSRYAWVMITSFIAIGAIAGSAGSAISMSKYLKDQGSVVSE